MSCWALVPVKARSAGKQRLAQALSEEARTRLIDRMLEQMLEAIAQCPAIASVAVVTPERARLPAGLRVLPDEGAGLNEVLQAALSQLEAQGVARVAIISADLPLLTGADVTALVQAAGDYRGRARTGSYRQRHQCAVPDAADIVSFAVRPREPRTT